MRFLLDTNVISEWRRVLRSDPGSLAWFIEVELDDCALSVITIGELKIGCERLKSRDPGRAWALEHWVALVLETFEGRILTVDEPVIDVWSRMAAPRSLPQFDGLIAATALRHGLTVVTRNVKDFAIPGLSLLNPFAET